MRSAKTPRLHEPLTRHKLDLTPLHPTTKDGEWVAFAIGDLGWLAGCRAKKAATGEQLEDLERRRGDKRFLMDGHPRYLRLCFAASSVHGTSVRTSATDLEVIPQAAPPSGTTCGGRD